MQTRRVHVASRTNAVINRLNKTRTEIPPPASSTHLRETRDAHLAELRRGANDELRRRRKDEARVAKERREEKERGEAEWEALYGDGRVAEEGRSNNAGWNEDDFM